MMLKARNVNDAYAQGLWWLKNKGRPEDSRNGKVLVMPHPVITEYSHSHERVLFDEKRDANPFFHLAECLWIMAGSRDVDFISFFNSRMREFSDNGSVLTGAYGHRLRRYFGRDQIREAIHLLCMNQHDRRVVLTMWDPKQDLNSSSKDVPCNTHVYLRVNSGYLDMTVCCRSNDVIWGAYGANAVHFSFLQEIIAWGVGVHVGTLFQFSNNFHIYERHWPLLDRPNINEENPYRHINVVPLVDHRQTWEFFIEDCEDILMKGDTARPTNHFLKSVVMPMIMAYDDRKSHNGEAAEKYLDAMPECDWKLASQNWIRRREHAIKGE